MKSLQDFRNDNGEFTFPEREEMVAALDRIEAAVQAIQTIDTTGVKDRLTRTARLDLASLALTEGEGYTRVVHSFKDLTRAELNYVEAWISSTGAKQALQKAGWTAEGAPKPKRIIQMIEADEMPRNTSLKIIKRFIA